MTGTIRQRAFGLAIDKRTISKLLRRSHTLFLFTVAISFLFLYATSKMLRKTRQYTQLHVRVLDNSEEYRKEKHHLKMDAHLPHRIKVVDLPGHQPENQLNNLKIKNDLATLNKMTEMSNSIELCKIFSHDILQEAIQENDVILISLHDTIRNSTLKMTTSLKWVTENCPNVRYVLRTEDDVIINTEKLMENVLTEIPEKNFAGGKCTIQSPVRNEHSKYFVSHKEYPHRQYPPICSNMGYIISYDVFAQLYHSVANSNVIPLDNVQMGVLLHQLDITPQNIPNLVHGKAFQMYVDPSQILCDYVIIHLHGHTEEETMTVWETMLKKCKRI